MLGLVASVTMRGLLVNPRQIRSARWQIQSENELARSNAPQTSSRTARSLVARCRMKRFANQRSASRHTLAGAFALITAIAAPTAAMADAGGLSFWLPGLKGSLAAVPGPPGWSWATVYVHLEVSADGSKNFIKGSSVVAGLQSHADAVATGPTYTFATPVLGGQAAFSVFAVPGDVGVGIDATLTGPRGRTISGTAH